MNKELIQRLAREAGMVAMPQDAEQTIYCISLRQQAAFAALVAEECAKVAEETDDDKDSMVDTSAARAAAIRERFRP
jgi:hypothetical protein